MSPDEQVTYFAETDFRNQRKKFGIKKKDRSRHLYVIGKTGMGKSTLLENMAAQDIMNGEGMCFMDPHGSAIDQIIDYIPKHRVKDVVYFAPFDTEYPMSFNVMEDVDPDKRHLVVAGLMASFKKIWVDAWSARMEYILSNTLLALLEYPGATLLGVNRMLAEKDYRNDVIKHITDASVKSFWMDEYNKWDPRYAREAGAAIQNKIGQFTANPLIRNIVGQQASSMDFRKIMDQQKILLVNLSKGLIGESNGNLLGGMLITKLYLAAMSRADVGAGNLEQLPNFFFFVDEFQNFANESFADILSEARKYKLNLTVAHQYVEQMEEEVSAAIFGNVGSMITFRIGATDAEIFEKQFAPTFEAEDIVNLGKFQIYLSLMIDGIGSRPFSARTLPPIEKPQFSMRDNVIRYSRAQYAAPRAEVEAAISKWYEPIKKPEKRSFKKDGSLKKSTSPSKKSHTVATDAKMPEKELTEQESNPKQTKEEARQEMKKVVSPKLHNLLDTLTDKESQKSKPTSNKSTKSKTSEKKNQAQDPTKKSSVSERGAQQKTQSSLKDVLAQALQKNTPQATQQQKNEKKEKKVKEITIKSKEKKETAHTAKKQTTKKPDNTRTDEKNLSPSQSPKETKETKKRTSKKEIPEDVLKDIFN